MVRKTVEDLVGDAFERFFQKRFPEFDRTIGPNMPDFEYPTRFYVETKAGNIRWGPKIKRYQLDDFKVLTNPVVYALGYHTFEDARPRLKGLSEDRAAKILDEELGIQEVLFISSELVEKVYQKHERVSKVNPKRYFDFKTSIANHLVSRKPFRSFGRKVEPESYYGFSYKDYLVFEQENKGIKWRAILHKRKDRKVIDFLRKEGIVYDTIGLAIPDNAFH